MSTERLQPSGGGWLVATTGAAMKAHEKESVARKSRRLAQNKEGSSNRGAGRLSTTSKQANKKN